jgi:MoxR-like ATPase
MVCTVQPSRALEADTRIPAAPLTPYYKAPKVSEKVISNLRMKNNVFISGLPGMGKSQLAAYVHQLVRTDRWARFALLPENSCYA